MSQEKKLKEIEETYKQWQGAFINGSQAMSRIGMILNQPDFKLKDGNSFQFVNIFTGEVLFEGKLE